jgi:hypothetical protein
MNRTGSLALAFFSYADMKSKALEALRSLLKRPDIIHGFFHTPSTRFASSSNVCPIMDWRIRNSE